MNRRLAAPDNRGASAVWKFFGRRKPEDMKRASLALWFVIWINGNSNFLNESVIRHEGLAELEIWR